MAADAVPAEGGASRAAGAAATIGAFTAFCVLVSNAVGSGIFTTTGFLARDLGDPAWILALWALGGALSLAGALSYAELGAALPKVGGEYVYLREAFGPGLAFLSGWTSFTMGFGAAIAASAIGFSQYLLVLLPEGLVPASPVVFAIGLVWALTGIHLLGVERGGSFQRWVTVLKIGGLGVLLGAAFGVGGGDWAHLRRPAPGVTPELGVAAVGLVFVLYSYAGWNAAAYIAAEIRRPERSLPRALVSGTVFVALLYLAVNLLYFYALPASALAAEPVLPVAEKAASALLGPAASAAVSALLCLSIAGAASSMVWTGPRVTSAMAQDGVLPAVLGRTSPAGAPTAAIALQCLWVTLLLLTGTFEQLVVYGGLAIALFSAAAVASLLVLRLRAPELARPFRVPGYPWVPASFILATLWIAGHALTERPFEALLSLATVAAGLPLYALARRRRRT
ncbi:MAG: amino acid permease [Myxococcota bacterium]|nr:amino acid permease [Myxococcota bacterium]